MEVLSRYEPLVDDFEAFLAACERSLPSVVRVNTIKAGVERTKRALEAEDVGYRDRDWNPTVLELDTNKPGNTWPYFHGWIHGQEEVSSLPATVLSPDPGERVLDACAAPGGKTAQIAALMDDTGLVVANDNNLGRLSALRFNAERLGLTNVAVTRQDARNFSLKPVGLDAFDRVLVDAPCSCEGIIRKRPDTLDEWSLSHVEGVSGVQKGILKRAIQATREGGVVVYSTCTFAPEENEAVLDHALEEEDCRVVEFETPLDSRPGVTEWQGERYHESVAKARRYYPHHNDTGGFFCAKLEVTG
ncbi:RsmB/NOP family class I SAM-dependent RNA methyltransferase [Halalkalicoccus jeotgali]|uniref:tRNA and rRNA cytosine-C5-methylase n=1 Tax=Halalkalicoccus jeotgali (strain DSM 18796 / CECT 7217 / JCM 14584 / KCTC 4019 / B3) TaxID=795797 RepID=D8J6F3_HALJB|nr:RsmB/NOP family class I SAM-dependent RNA methyltransferase [Halalkalicoccus jeotgali]ADJ15871.1 tRNA and rRNA cytosine-C5-methylase [Halalkalicoccus jeotgali B3]ELY37967.1 tRNA and rRNA cytosine-C5-methylase [Halalkalicoccus jeotgali B3]